MRTNRGPITLNSPIILPNYHGYNLRSGTDIALNWKVNLKRSMASGQACGPLDLK